MGTQGKDAAVAPVAGGKIVAGTPAFRAVTLAMFSCGFSIFAILYCPQPILPLLVQEFSVTPVQASLALSLTTITLAVAMLFASSLSEAVGRKPLMFAALFLSALLTLGLAFATTWTQILWLRALAGIALSGMPAVTLAYLAEEIDPKSVASAVGLYIGGSAFGGMTGRLVAAFLADYGSWRWAMAGIAATGLVSSFVFLRALAPSRHFVPRALSPAALVVSLVRHLGNVGIVLLVIEGFLLLGAYVTLFNYLGFRLQAPPFNMSQSLASLIFLVYPIGSVGSAWMGAMAARHGRGRMLIITIAIMIAGLAMMTPDSLVAIALGLAVMTFGFFGAHSISSGWVPSLTVQDRAQASSLYLLFYYIGGGVAGSFGGVFWTASGWTGVSLFCGAMMLGTFVLALGLRAVARSQ